MKTATILFSLALCATMDTSAQIVFGISSAQDADCTNKGSINLSVVPLTGGSYTVNLLSGGILMQINGTEPIIDSTLEMLPGTVGGSTIFYDSLGMWTADYQVAPLTISQSCFISIVCEGAETIIHPSNGEVIFQVNGEETMDEELVLDSTTYVEVYTIYDVQVFAGTVLDTCGVTTSTPDQPEHSTLSFYPNPATDKVTIAAGDYDNYEIFDLLGQSWRTGTFQGTEKATVTIDDLPTGSYIVRVSSGSSEMVGRLVVQ